MSRRLKRLSVSRKHFTSFLTLGPKVYQVVEDGLPSDAVVVGVEMSFPSDGIVFWVQSDQFDDVPDGERIPEISPILNLSQCVHDNDRCACGKPMQRTFMDDAPGLLCGSGCGAFRRDDDLTPEPVVFRVEWMNRFEAAKAINSHPTEHPFSPGYFPRSIRIDPVLGATTPLGGTGRDVKVAQVTVFYGKPDFKVAISDFTAEANR